MSDIEAGSAIPAPVKLSLAGYTALLCTIFVCCAAAIFSYFAAYPLLRSAAIGAVNAGFWLFTITAPIVFGAAFLLPKRDLIASAKVHASLYVTYVLILAQKLGPTATDFISFLFFILFIELVLLVVLLQRAPKEDRELSGAPWLFSALTVALLAGSACGALIWYAAVRAEIADKIYPAEERLLRRSSDVGPCNPVMHHPS